VSDQALLTRPGQEGISAQLQERIRAFTAFYEQHAYLAYNLALRITCESRAAGRAVEHAFLKQLDEHPAGLVAGTVEAALRQVPARPDPSGAGDPEAQALLSAMSGLAPTERAAIALADLASAGPEGIGDALGLPRDQAAKLLHRGREALGAALGLPRPQADESARDWMWAAPPAQIWEELYQRFHVTVERQLRRGSAEHTLVLKADAGTVPAEAGRRAGRRLRRAVRVSGRPRWARRLRWNVALPLAAILLAAGAVAATQLPGFGQGADPAGTEQYPAAPVPGDPASTQSATGDPAVKPHKPLTAALLDKLRLRELRQLREYSKRQADSSLPARQRRSAARRIAAIERAAQQRLRAQRKREAALADREARQRARDQASAPPPPPSAERPRSQRPTRPETPERDGSTPAGPPRNREEADKTCLLNEESGQYICPG
jgi:hypothetical protein